MRLPRVRVGAEREGSVPEGITQGRSLCGRNGSMS